MKYVDEFRNPELTTQLLHELTAATTKPFRVMEVCGTHTMAIFRSGLRAMLPPDIELISGPGCPVCVTSASHIDAFLQMAELPGTQLAVFGDLFRVPGSNGTTLAHARARGAKIDVVYSPMDGLELARQNPAEQVIFPGIGFETTTPGIAATILAARQQNIDNFMVFSTHKTMLPPLMALLGDPALAIDGLLCPGHVSSIIGAAAYQPLAEENHLSCVVGGFEPTDILQALILMARQISEGRAEVENAYTRAVTWEGNARARTMVAKIFEPVDMEWRGLGLIKGSGLAIREEYTQFDAQSRLSITVPESKEPPGCLCGQILKGMTTPPVCPLFGRRCTPGTPIGPCMVSSEGTCSAWFTYGNYSENNLGLNTI
ncbi:MAG: hydrogenase formation protein HypD [Proteobacteria bacterium]|jgi:hydrogenase expression/formation protein HypD|nr:hydrogenase formation protein HypD [Desulfocapsa sp.]MBU3944567.1 hydrogenase formation protein HypD [Pseudomonadota bacterium]MCG2744624.1 hydrogenase formation protein HypD [Desulfobacteraceae bacterium]MBU3983185.1 hydrogenase formation protein HypD [Pseudomonadota bacterium]MBU4029623.1 hydrogenase formation protein HypD [Pseudomonadota bacterium]